MIKSIKIENFKSIQSLEMELGRLNIFIGANGSGKSNILEAIAMGSADVEDSLVDEFLVNRGIRISEPKLMKAGFKGDNWSKPIYIKFSTDGYSWDIKLHFKGGHYNNWEIENSIKTSLLDIQKNIKAKEEELKQLSTANNTLEETLKQLKDSRNKNLLGKQGIETFNIFGEILISLQEQLNQITKEAQSSKKKYNNIQPRVNEVISTAKFMIYAPENHFLRLFEDEASIKPVGVKGEGLFKLITIIAEEKPEQFQKIKEHLKLIDWFEGFEIPGDLKFTEKRIKIKDAYLDEDLQYFDQRSANEGFLYLLFYLTLFISDETPHFFSIDNIDNALNPKLGSELIKILAQLSKDHNKQALLTTHNPVILDGLDLTDDDQRLFVVYRNADGHTKVRRIMPPKSPNGTKPVRLSEAFIRGYIGGLPKNF